MKRHPLMLDKEIRRLTEIGFLAAAVGDVRSAETIFTVITQLDPRKLAPHVGLALAHMNAERTGEAVKVLELAADLVEVDDLPTLQALRALALQLDGRVSESQRLLKAYPQSALSKSMQGLPTALLSIQEQ